MLFGETILFLRVVLLVFVYVHERGVVYWDIKFVNIILFACL